VLKLEGASGLTPATLDTSEALAVGDQITGVGNAGGTGTLSAAAGTVTGLDQSVTTQAEGSSAGETLDGMIQVAADIQSGDSGGPLYDADGEVVGIDTAASSGSTDVTGFAIPITDALDIAKQIASGQETSTVTLGYPAFLGIEVAGDASTSGGSGSLGAGSAGGSAGSTGSAGSVAGATVAGVIAGTPAETAGLVAGDVITAVDGTSVASGTALTTTLKGYEPGNTVTITYTDAAGASHSVKATLVEGPVA
jgi:S1-C subfamily serine protease